MAQGMLYALDDLPNQVIRLGQACPVAHRGDSTIYGNLWLGFYWSG
jgi:hypothetical protein